MTELQRDMPFQGIKTLLGSGPISSSGRNSILVFNDTPHFVIPYHVFDTSVISIAALKIQLRNYIDFIIRHITNRILLYSHVMK
jgi:hypothetical protein